MIDQSIPPTTTALPLDDKQLIELIRAKPQLLSINQIYESDSASTCSYCHKEAGSYSWSFTKKKMEPYTYQVLMERGWRRCGNYYYKPDLFRSCCKLFTHRLYAPHFQPKKHQRKTIKKLIPLLYQPQEPMQPEPKHPKNPNPPPQHNSKPAKPQPVDPQVISDLTVLLKEVEGQLREAVVGRVGLQGQWGAFTWDWGEKLKFFRSKAGQKWDYYCNWVMLLFGSNKKLFAEKYSLIDFVKEVKPLIEALSPRLHTVFEVERGGYLLFKQDTQQSKEFQVLEEEKPAMQMEEEGRKEEGRKGGLMGLITTIKNKFKAEPEVQRDIGEVKLKEKNSGKFQVLKPQITYKGEFEITAEEIRFGKLIIKVVPAEESEESFRLYQKYTKEIHEKKEKAMSSYVNFLCLNALTPRSTPSPIPPPQRPHYLPTWDPAQKHTLPRPLPEKVDRKSGCYHMKYYLQGRLIGVGVVDLLEQGLSSVYFFYDPAYKEYRLGVFSSLVEIEYVRWMGLSHPHFNNYYMGFYIANCEKMNYKADYAPCQLLCPLTYRFVPFDAPIQAKTALIADGKEKDVRLAKEGEQVVEDMTFGRDLGPLIDRNLKLIYNNRRLVLREINPAFFVHILKILKQLVPVIGKKAFDMISFTI